MLLTIPVYLPNANKKVLTVTAFTAIKPTNQNADIFTNGIIQDIADLKPTYAHIVYM